MDPNLFRIDWEVLAEVLTTIIVLSFFVERALSILFEHRFYLMHFKDTGFKEPIALALSFAIVSKWKFDALAVILQADQNSWWGYLVTASIISGGSKASIKFFHDVLNTKSQSLRESLATPVQAVKKEKASSDDE